MTGIELLRKMANNYKICARIEKTANIDLMCVSQRLFKIADQIEREYVEAAADHAVVASVVAEMERHVSGVEGMEDSPVARWARELRQALGGHVEEVTDVATIRKDAMEAYEWVEAHGGLEEVKLAMKNFLFGLNETCVRLGIECSGSTPRDYQSVWREIEALRSRLKESVPRAAYERHLARRQRQIDESHAALRRRNRSIAKLERRAAGCASSMLKSDASAYELQRAVLDQCKAFGVDVSECNTAFDMLHGLMDALDRRLMPDGMEWPMFEDGEPVRIGDEFMGKDGKTYTVKQVQLIGKFYALYDFCDAKPQFVASYGERVRRPAPKVLDVDGVEIRVGDTVWTTNGHGPFEVTRIVHADRLRVICDDEESGNLIAYPESLTHRAPVLAADGKPLCEGEHVWHVEAGTELVVKELPNPGAYQAVVVFAPPASHLASFDPDQLTHERPDTRAQVIAWIDKETVERIDRLVRDGRWLDD